ncbi:MAG: hypothetical protein ACRCY9_11770 [Phycicoccus sp.]
MTTRRDITTLIDSNPEILRVVGFEAGQAVSRIDEPPAQTAEWTGAAREVQRWEVARQQAGLADSQEKFANGIAALDGYGEVAQHAKAAAITSLRQHEYGVALGDWVRQHSGLTLTWESMRVLTSAFEDSLRHQQQGVEGMQASDRAVLVASSDLHGVLARNVPSSASSEAVVAQANPYPDRLQNPVPNRPMPPVRPEQGVTVEPVRDQPVNPPGKVPEVHLEIANPKHDRHDVSLATWRWRGMELDLRSQASGKIGTFNGILDGTFNNAMTTRAVEAQKRLRHWNQTFDEISQATQRRIGELQVRTNDAVQEYNHGARRGRAARGLNVGLRQTEQQMRDAQAQTQRSVRKAKDIVDDAARNSSASNRLAIERLVERYSKDPYEAAAQQARLEALMKENGFRNGDALDQIVAEHEELNPAPFSDMDFTEQVGRLPIADGSVLFNPRPSDVPTPPSLDAEFAQVDAIGAEGEEQQARAMDELRRIGEDGGRLPTGMPEPDEKTDPNVPYGKNPPPERGLVSPLTIQEYIDRQLRAMRVGQTADVGLSSVETAKDFVPFGHLLPSWKLSFLPTSADPGQIAYHLAAEDNVNLDGVNNINAEYVRQQAAELRYEIEDQNKRDFDQVQASQDASQRITTDNFTNSNTQQGENAVEDAAEQAADQKRELAISTSADAKEQAYQNGLQNYLRNLDREAAAVTGSYGAVVPQLGHMAARQDVLFGEWPDLAGWYAYIRYETANRPAVEQYAALEMGMRYLYQHGDITLAEYRYYQGEFQAPIPQEAPTPVDELINRKTNY